MTYIPLDSFLPKVIPYVRDCPEPVAKGALRDTLIEFCQRTHWLVDEQVTVTLLAATSVYNLDPPEDTDITSIAEVRVNDITLTPKSADELEQMFTRDWRKATGRPRYYLRETPGELTICPTPAETVAGGLTYKLVLMPAQDAALVDDELYFNWAEGIAAGARARLHEIPGFPFSDEAASAKFRARFEGVIATARRDRNQGMTRGPQSVRMPRLV